jgi:hypothetical protein
VHEALRLDLRRVASVSPSEAWNCRDEEQEQDNQALRGPAALSEDDYHVQ